MADSVTNRVVRNGRYYVSRHMCVSDGSGESAVVKVDISTLLTRAGIVPTYTQIDRIEYSVNGMILRPYWDHTTDDLIAVLEGSGVIDVQADGGLVDPRSAGGTGDIIFTTTGAASGSNYDVTLYTKLKA